MSKIISIDTPIKINDKYNSMDVANAFINKMVAMGVPGADKIPLVTDDEG